MSNVLTVLLLTLLSLTLSSAKNEAGIIDLFNGKDLDGWEGIGGDASKNWEVKDGTLSCTGGKGAQWIATKQEFSDFDLSMDFKLPENGNSGILMPKPISRAPISKN